MFVEFAADKNNCNSSLEEDELSLNKVKMFDFDVPLCFAIYVNLQTNEGGGIINHTLTSAVVL